MQKKVIIQHIAVTVQIPPKIHQFKAQNVSLQRDNDHYVTPKWRMLGVS